MRVVIAEDHYLVREGARRLLEDGGEVEVVGAVGTAEELRKAVRRYRPDAVIADIRMPPAQRMEGLDAAHAIREEHPEIGVVVLSQHADEAYALDLFRHGTSGLAYLLKDRLGDLEQLLHALRETCRGGSVIDADIVELLVTRRIQKTHSPLRRLSPREVDVLREMAQGKTNAAIAETLVVSRSAVEKHVGAIFAKLGLSDERQVHRRVAAVVRFMRDADEVGFAG